MMSSKTAFDLSSFLPYQLAVLANRTSKAFSDSYSEAFGLSIPEWRVLAHLSQESHVSVREIHERVEMDKSKVSRAAHQLQMTGLIRKVSNENDRRLVALSLTAKGRKIMEKITPMAHDYAQKILEPLEPHERDVLLSAVEKLLDASAGRGGTKGSEHS